MLYIQKEKEPEQVTQWKKKFKHVHKRKPSYDDIQQTVEKGILKSALIREQKGLCCYCCGRLAEDDAHIEHFKPKGLQRYAPLSLDYQNLHASCMGEKKDGRHCGHSKGNRFDETLLISPLDPACEGRFAFKTDGRIAPMNPEDDGANYTIELLSLCDKRLCKAREAAMWEAGVFTFETDQEKEALIEMFSMPDQDGFRAPYSDAVLYHLRKD